MSTPTVTMLIIAPFGVMLVLMALTLVVGYMGWASGKKSRPVSPLSPETYAAMRELVARGKHIPAIKMLRQETGMGLKEAKYYVDAMQEGRIQPPAAPGGLLADRVRAFRDAGGRDSAVALVQAETGMSRQEAIRFVDALD